MWQQWKENVFLIIEKDFQECKFNWIHFEAKWMMLNIYSGQTM